MWICEENIPQLAHKQLLSPRLTLLPVAWGNPAGAHARIKTPYYTRVVDLHNRLNFPTTHPLNITAAATGVLSAADLVLALDVKDLYGPLTRLDRVARRTEYITPGPVASRRSGSAT